MIAHVSFAALIGGVAFEFPVVPGAWIAVAEDRTGLAIEVYPETMAHHPGTGEVDHDAKPEGPMNPEACAAMFGKAHRPRTVTA